jgi:phospholipase/lecithinase/hemolysin
MSTAKQDIQRVIILGDSLSDRGTMQKKPIIGGLLLPSSKSREGSFTNAYTWDDQYAAVIASQYFIKKILNITAEEIKTKHSAFSIEELNSIIREVNKIQQLARDSTLDAIAKQMEISVAISNALQDNPAFKRWFQNTFNLDDDKRMTIDGQPLVRTYCIGRSGRKI